MKKNVDQDFLDEKPDHKFLDQLYEYQKLNFVDSKFDKRAKEHFICQCDLCEYDASDRKQSKVQTSQQHLRSMPDMRRKSSVLMRNIPGGVASNTSQQEKDFFLVMKRLVPPNKFLRSIRLTIPETCFFQNGDPKFIVYSGKVWMRYLQLNYLPGKGRKTRILCTEIPKVEINLPSNKKIYE